ncbi:MFS transporter [Luteitalea sp. TBR-22]|uniref:MFS transporter n=1 Tax=Luteitalea sp. TBR-22 TaxID=2802971 RepID=UPI001AF9B721|nr:MFS transporter [Luteitalea sp. TBR-22]BCS34225.1 MFS transporter [Luteitalea sp. TBR-22]
MASAPRPIKHLRWYIAVLLCLASELNYLDRQALSVLATQIQKDVGFTDAQYGQITSAFLMSYSVMYLVSGRILDMIGTRKGYLYFVAAWSVAAMSHALARTPFHFQAARFALGAAEAAVIPGGVKAATEWFPVRERALAVGIFNAGTALGSTLAVPLIGAISLYWGWRAAFIVSGGLGLMWLPLWAWLYHRPEDHKHITAEERTMILSDRGATDGQPPPSMGVLLRMKETWGCVAARVLTDPISYLLNFWVLKYLEDQFHIPRTTLLAVGWLPYAALATGNIASGAIPRYMVNTLGFTVNRARKLTTFTVSVTALVLFLVLARIDSVAPLAARVGLDITTLAIICVTAVMFCHGAWGNVILPAEVFPARAVGSVTGLGGLMGSVAGVITQRMIGHVVEGAGYAPVFLVCASAYLIAFFAVVVLIGELGRIREVRGA